MILKNLFILVMMCFYKNILFVNFYLCWGVIAVDAQRNFFISADLPQEIMVDVINNFGVQLLKKHNEFNNNNLALSPYGAVSVLVALQEGTRGIAQSEITQNLRLPRDISTVRIGLRDVLRRLKTYFIPEEGFLAGLTFNNDNISLKTDYKNLLMFYGYDVESFNTPLSSTTTKTSEVVSERSQEATPPLVEQRNPDPESFTTTVKSDEISDGQEKTSVSLNSNTEPTPNNVITTTESAATTDGSTQIGITTVTAESERSSSADDNSEESSTIFLSNMDQVTETPVVPSSTPMIVTTTVENIVATTTEVNNDEIITTDVDQESQSSSTTTVESNSDENLELTTTENETDNEVVSTESSSELSVTNTEETNTEISQTTLEVTESSPAKTKKREVNHKNTPSKHYLPSSSHSGHYPREKYAVDSSTLSFLINGETREPNISFMTYQAVLPYCYISALKSIALSFPLDSDNYYLLIILPLDDCGADFVLERIGFEVTLRDVVSALSYTYVKATIPSFVLQGTVLLTQTLQKMGIKSVFEPGGADFSTMTDAEDIYVTNVEQTITVTIRNYIDPNTLDYFGNHYHQNPVWFKADHPFLYFVMDSQLHVSLMSGKVANPLNSRIS